MFKHINTILFSLALVFSASALSAGAIDFTIHEDYLSPRAMGMGNAFTAIADDYSAPFYNPAGLAFLEYSQVNMGFGGNVDPKALRLLDDIKAKSGATASVSEMTTLLEQNFGNHYSLRVPYLGGTWVKPGFGLAVLPADISMDMSLHQGGGATLSLVAFQDTTIATSFARKVSWFGLENFAIGITPKLIHRVYFNKAISAVDLALDSNVMKPEDAQEGLAVDADFGLLWKGNDEIFWGLKPSLGLAIRNAVSSGYVSNFHVVHKDSTSPPALGRRFDLGSSLDLPDWWVWKSKLALDIRDMGDPHWSPRKGLHVGVEFLWKIRSWWRGGWRAGLNQGYLTAGFAGVIGIFKLDIGTYAKEVGTSDSAKQNRTFFARFSLDW